MPELPEVETIRRDLLKKVVNKKISNISILNKKTVRNKQDFFLRALKGNKITDIKRTGKLIIFQLDKNGYLLTHLKMTGQLVYWKKGKITAGGHSLSQGGFDLPNKHTRVRIDFEDGAVLFFNDMRLFGYMEIVDSEKLRVVLDKFGIEPLTPNYTPEKFVDIFKNRRTSLKAILLNQNLIAGLGNIYADESCFQAGICPDRKAVSLNSKEIKKLYQAIKIVLKKALENRGTTFNNYVDSDGRSGNFVDKLKVYGRAGEACKNCRNKLKRIKLAGRSTVFCEKCQK
ncbi:MAG: DNA-formamidopyrimidine glycosylase [Candidatus Magasanikbacteria bacterium RIFOXYB2_FULL_40_13]|uniref:Formamidopyrimidine-DNA glycosylase n=2 Tax=Candidatus Magasanikiibacteriota TaxID=1752731 RepID=A0A1F6NKE3_9BACT|nr:MAG: DNA-formamidopyrimidine glycosylase [Candidatus Magasanikbacteria bacterium RIFOXYB1_FULL_40_15]OGH86541.1 MAG: DNA-formamidopyrimidine glycosylase [Candidatus Magasanikbacteria bacterium RIFOXYB2_FULL_40_13]OGH87937.1 MAG: DNA-formamidopyrimidine glycosylase [Candidatus Magasanikbacteria bacterium RIFOXYA1_FULL_40_8]